jgi:alpha-galactosidase
MPRFAFLFAVLLAATAANAASPAPTPPMGWNSWDAYGLTIDEGQFKANAQVLAGLGPDWRYAVIDEGWYMGNPFGDKLATRDYQLDGNGRLIPATSRFPSAADGAGFKPLADWAHVRGLKFGIHIVRGIPRQAVHDNLPVADSKFRAADAADTSDTCGWDDGNYGVADNEAGQAYYDSLLKLYAQWGLDFLKVDCIADHPYKASEIRQIALAIQHSGRPIVLSLSPGPAQIAHAAELARYAQMWRIANDIWDGWQLAHVADDFPNGLVTGFDNLAKWNPYVRPGQWPDADMLPFGSLTPHPGWGEPRLSGLTLDEERTQFSLWAIARSPLILGANLTKLDDATRALITDDAIIALDQQGQDQHPLANLPPGFEHARAWETMLNGVPVLAIFNLDAAPLALRAKWTQLGLSRDKYSAHDLWSGETAISDGPDVTLPAHGCVVYRLDLL